MAVLDQHRVEISTDAGPRVSGGLGRKRVKIGDGTEGLDQSGVELAVDVANVVRRKLFAVVPDIAASGPPPGLVVSVCGLIVSHWTTETVAAALSPE